MDSEETEEGHDSDFSKYPIYDIDCESKFLEEYMIDQETKDVHKETSIMVMDNMGLVAYTN